MNNGYTPHADWYLMNRRNIQRLDRVWHEAALGLSVLCFMFGVITGIILTGAVS